MVTFWETRPNVTSCPSLRVGERTASQSLSYQGVPDFSVVMMESACPWSTARKWEIIFKNCYTINYHQRQHKFKPTGPMFVHTLLFIAQLQLTVSLRKVLGNLQEKIQSFMTKNLYKQLFFKLSSELPGSQSKKHTWFSGGREKDSCFKRTYITSFQGT